MDASAARKGRNTRAGIHAARLPSLSVFPSTPAQAPGKTDRLAGAEDIEDLDAGYTRIILRTRAAISTQLATG